MFSKIKGLFSRSKLPQELEFTNDNIVPVAAAMVLLEVAWADHQLLAEEQELIESALVELYDIDQEKARSILNEAEHEHKISTSLHRFTKTLNHQLDIGEKITLVMHLWRMNNLSTASFHYEESMIRKVADLLHLRHSEFIRAKLAAKEV